MRQHLRIIIREASFWTNDERIQFAAYLLNKSRLTFHDTDTFSDSLCEQTRDELLSGSTRWNCSTEVD
jgi:hypothetical protein